MLKKCKVVMLSTNEKAKYGDFVISMYDHNKELAYGITTQTPYRMSETRQHLYIISDDEIKEGDWFINNDGLWQCTGGIIPTGLNPRKIIATTDSSLEINKTCISDTLKAKVFESFILPQPSQSFIEVFVREYNKGNVITDVMVEYSNKLYCDTCQDILVYNNRNHKCIRCKTVHTNCVDILKINPKDNTITIKKLKDSWSKDEHELELRKAIKAGIEHGKSIAAFHIGDLDDRYAPLTEKSFENKWIEENL